MPILNGGVASVGTFIQLSSGVGPDGLALDSSSGLLIAHAGTGAVWVFNARVEPTYRVNTPAGNLSTNLAFGGPENRDIFYR
nr:SMP-30/gluconolactonase/LRE family protein [Paraburkholderia sp. BL18I3N2]